jgi:hypothetical protein
MNENTKRVVHSQLWLAALMVTVGFAIAGLSLARLHAQHQLEMAQATGTPGQPLQATPSPQPTNAPPAEAKPGGTRPTTPAPEPARPDPQAQQEGARPALPPAPAEKMAPPIPEKK